MVPVAVDQPGLWVGSDIIGPLLMMRSGNRCIVVYRLSREVGGSDTYTVPRHSHGRKCARLGVGLPKQNSFVFALGTRRGIRKRVTTLGEERAGVGDDEDCAVSFSG